MTVNAGANIAIKVQRRRWSHVVGFYENAVGLEVLARRDESVVFAFGGLRLWIDAVDDERSGVWLQLHSDDVAADLARLIAVGAELDDALEPLGHLDAHWVRDPAGTILLLSRAIDEDRLDDGLSLAELEGP